jgi:phage baseplate assembly protein V
VKHLIRAMLRVGRIKLVDDSGPIQRFQIFEGSLGNVGGDRLIDKVAHIAQFGFASSPPLDSEVMLVAPAGDRTQTIALGTNHQPSRPKILKAGDAILYDVRGAMVWLSADGIIIDGAGLPIVVRNSPTVTVTAVEKITLDAPLTECTGNFKADRLLTGDGSPIELGALRDAYNAHKHTGVATGSGSSGTTDHAV